MDVLLNAIKEDDGQGKKKGARTGAAAAAAAGAGVEVRACVGACLPVDECGFKGGCTSSICTTPLGGMVYCCGRSVWAGWTEDRRG